MQSFQHSRARILFEVACAFGISASCVEAWTQTYATAMLAAAAIAALYGLVHAFDMVRRSPKADVPAEAADPATEQGNRSNYLDAGDSEPVIDAVPEFVAPPAEVVAETNVKRNRKSSRQKPRRDRKEAAPEIAVAVEAPEPEVAVAFEEPQPQIADLVEEPEPEVAEPEPELHVVETASDEPEYVPATPLFEPEPFVRQQRAAFGRKARY